MEAAHRQSRILSTYKSVPLDPQTRKPVGTYHRESQAMATATLISPGSVYSPHRHHTLHYPSTSYTLTSPALAAAPMPSTPASVVTPTEPRRSSDVSDKASRQSLPSLHEVINGQPDHFARPPPPSLPPQSQSLLPYGTSRASRPYGEAPVEGLAISRPLHPQPSYSSRHEPIAGFADRPPIGNRPAPPPLNTYPPSLTRMDLDHFEGDQRHVEPRQMAPGYSPAAPPPGQLLYPLTRPLPPGQLPLNFSPHSSAGAGLPSHYEPHHSEESDHLGGYHQDRTFQTRQYLERMRNTAAASRSVFDFARAYCDGCKDLQGQELSLPRLPSEKEINQAIVNLDMAKRELATVKQIVTETRAYTEQRIQVGARKAFEDEDVGMYERPAGPFVLDVKKRRGRPAAPGRCHSCNRIDTPEWRRGPDGARTLCNACGLHYAKLERKRLLEGRAAAGRKQAAAAEERS